MKAINRIICFIFGHSWGVPNEYHSPVWYRVCKNCKKEKYYCSK